MPLCNLLEKDVPFKFDEEFLAIFKSLKKSLTTTPVITAPVITAPDWNKPFKMMCDASDHAVRAVLGQRKQNIFHVVYYAKRFKTLLDLMDSLTSRIRARNQGSERYRKSGSRSSITLEDHDKVSLDKTLINESFPDEQLFGVQEKEPWFADTVNYLVSNVIPPKLSYAQRKKFLYEAKWYRWDEPFLFRQGGDQIIRRCIPYSEMEGIFNEGSHFCNRKFTALMEKYHVNYRIATTYHPQTNGQAEVSNREIKHILEKVVSPSRIDWSLKLDEAVWVYRIAFKTPLGMSPFQLVYGNACHLFAELEHKAYWALKKLNLDIEATGEKRMLQPNELEEFRLQAYENNKV
ncbi:uncharacterized protein LOC141679603 [Apium graveolens]|uniref:uncharacterized protein LOC141679603 n=1 Tax=Apium graveolens TaxID=4045 RepID=UPI003D7C05FF